MPYMYCNHQGCNETVKLPANYCAKHKTLKVPEPLPEPDSVKPLQDIKVSDLTLNVDVDKVSNDMNTKKTTK